MEKSSLSLSDGIGVIRRYLETMPDTPGVYRMFDGEGNALYIGKAKNLRQRVSSYTHGDALAYRLQQMVAQTASMEITTTRSEAEALLLEANMVKKFSPRYNILLKDDKSFPYIFLSSDSDFPRIAKHRGPKTAKGKYFGPFVSAHAVNETITLLQKAFLLRPCSDSVFKNRTRPCLQYQIRRCSAPCVGKIGKADYAALAGQAQEFLSGRSRRIQDAMVEEMQRLSLKMDYEKARVVRDRIRALAAVQGQQGDASVGDADVIGMAREAGQSCLQLFSFRGGRNYGGKTWFPAHTAGAGDAEVLGSFIGQLYQSQVPPPLILVSHMLDEASLIEEALRLGRDYKIEIVHPLRGEKRGLVALAERNAREALARHLSMHQAQRGVLKRVRELFGLDETPRRIEVYDNSHISGTHAVGAMIVAGPEGFLKTEYRRFNIKSEDIADGDDYAMLREVLTRRFKKLQEEDGKRPDLVLLDGGAGQVSAAASVFEELGVQDITYAGISKGPDRNAGREWFHIPGREPFQLPPGDAALHYLQRLRDEAHRFAIGAHRARRSKALRVSELDAIPAVGPGRKRALLHHFGSAKAVSAASQDDISKVPGISAALARTIFEHFHGEA